uniref:DNA primase n=1 Tax=Macrostomum lignano TaxID=282301 RepID=A0A1I8F9J3_9PLAT
MLDILRHCEYRKCQRDDVIIWQGERGEECGYKMRQLLMQLDQEAKDKQRQLQPEAKEEEVAMFDRKVLAQLYISIG